MEMLKCLQTIFNSLRFVIKLETLPGFACARGIIVSLHWELNDIWFRVGIMVIS